MNPMNYQCLRMVIVGGETRSIFPLKSLSATGLEEPVETTKGDRDFIDSGAAANPGCGTGS